MDEVVDTFTAFTGATADVARRYLGMTENNAEQAIQLFFDSPDLASGIDQPSQAPPVPHATRPQPVSTSEEHQGTVGARHFDSDNEEGMDIDDDNTDEQASTLAAAAGRAADYEDDEAMARRMQEELYASGDGSSGFGADSVRAPIARTTETLVGGAEADYPDNASQLLQQMRARAQPRAGGMGFNIQVWSTLVLMQSQDVPVSSTNALFRLSGTNPLTQLLAVKVLHKPQEGHQNNHQKPHVLLSCSDLPSNS
jgi:hypothetical protein